MTKQALALRRILWEMVGAVSYAEYDLERALAAFLWYGPHGPELEQIQSERVGDVAVCTFSPKL